MRPLGNDRWQAQFPLERIGRHLFIIEAWRDAFATFRDELGKKHEAGVDVRLELQEGRGLVEAAAAAGAGARRRAGAAARRRAPAAQVATLLAEETARLMAEADPRPFAVRLEPEGKLDAERRAAGFASWYEIFPRSMSDDPHRHGTFADVIRHLPRIRDMGFDVLYFPPIHPIGRINRKGRNNSLSPAPDDPGSPYAIGATEGGHDAIHPELGTLEDFQALRQAAAAHGLELALDFAIQCAPDHPWLAAASGLVRLAAGRIAEIRRESAEEIRGHRQRRFLRRAAQCPACGSRCARSCCSGATRASASSASTTRTPSRSRSGSG